MQDVLSLLELDVTLCSTIYSAELLCTGNKHAFKKCGGATVPVILHIFKGSCAAKRRAAVKDILQLCKHPSIPTSLGHIFLSGTLGVVLYPAAMQAVGAGLLRHDGTSSSTCCPSGLTEEDIRQAAAEAAHVLDYLHTKKV